MAAGSITSSVSGTTTTYVVSDSAGDTVTIAAAAPPGGLTFSGSGSLRPDGQIMLGTLVNMLVTGLRPNVLGNTVASFSN